MIQIDHSLFLQIINFVLLIFILNFLLYKPMLSIIDKRKRTLENSEDEINRLKRSIEEKTALYEERLRSVRNESLGKNKELVKEGSERAKGIMDDANREISLMAEEFHGKLQSEVQTSREFLSDRSRLLSVQIAERVLGRSLQ